jgi:hypothetical protein
VAEPLTRRERDILAFERHAIGGMGLKEAIASKLWPDLHPTRYYQLLAALIGRPEAEEAAPEVVRRLRGIQEARRRAINPVRSGPTP